MKQNLWKKCIICAIIVFLIGACVTPLVTGLEIPEQSSEDNEKVKENLLFDEIDGLYFGCKIDITFTDEVSNLPIGLPIPLFAAYVYFHAFTVYTKNQGNVKVSCSDGTSVDFDNAYYIEFMLFGFVGANTLTPLIDFNGGRVTGYAAVAIFDAWTND